MGCGNEDEFLREAVKFIAKLECLNSPSCAIFLPTSEPGGPRVQLAASTDDSLTSKLEDPKEAMSLGYELGYGLTGATARVGPQHALRIVRADNRKEVHRIERILRIATEDPELEVRWSHHVPDKSPGMPKERGARNVMAHCFEAPGRSKFRHGVLRVSRPVEGYEWDRYMPFDAQLIRELSGVVSEALRYYGTMADVISEFTHRHTRDLRTILARLPADDRSAADTSTSEDSLDELRIALSAVRIIAQGAVRVNQILRPPELSWKDGSMAPWRVRLDVLIDELVAARKEIARPVSPLLEWSCEVPEGILLPERTATFLGMCLNELLTNAANYSPRDTSATVSVRAKRWGTRLFVDIANPTSRDSYNRLRKSPSGTTIADVLLKKLGGGKRQASYDAELEILTQRVKIELDHRQTGGGQ